MTLKVTFWGALADLAGPERVVDRARTPEAVRDALAPAGDPLGDALRGDGVLVMADDELIEWTADLSDVRELAFMPPMSGG